MIPLGYVRVVRVGEWRRVALLLYYVHSTNTLARVVYELVLASISTLTLLARNIS